MKRILSTLILCAASIGFIQAQRFQSGELYYNITDTETKTVEVTFEKHFSTLQNYSNISPHVVIPETVVYQQEEYSITGISADAFRNCYSLISISIPKSVGHIGTQAFDACNNLTDIQVAENNANYSSQNGALFNADKTVLILFPPANEATKFVVPETVTEIQTSAFSYGKLKEIQIPDGVTSIGFGAFYRCEELEKVNLPRELKCIEYDTFWGCEKLAEINIPEGVTTIEQKAFYGCSSLTKVTLPESLDSIAYSVFEDCSSLSEINIPEGVFHIGDQAFSSCSSLSAINIPKSITYIGGEAFSSCSSLSAIIIPEGITYIAGRTFYDCSLLTKVTLPESLDSIAYSVFDGCRSLSEINIPEGVTYIGESAFQGCEQLSKITLPESLKDIAYNTFASCLSLKEINIPKNVRSIGDYAFSYCSSLTGINLPEGVIHIGGGAFSGCDTLQEITIPASVGTIIDGAFDGCNALKACYVVEGNKNYSTIDGVLFNADKTRLILYPASRVATEFTIPMETDLIADRAFDGCNALKAFHVAGGNKSYSAIDGVLFNADKTRLILYPVCKEDISYTVPSGTVSIAGYAFHQNKNLTELILSESVENIEPCAFMNAHELKRAVINDKLQKISKQAFEMCIKLEEVVFGKNIHTIDDGAFRTCMMLKEINLPDMVETIGADAFIICQALKKVSFGKNLQTIGEYAFAYCDSLREMTVWADNPPVVQDGAFRRVTSESVVYVPEEALGAYQNATPWNEFNLQPIDTGTAIEMPAAPDGLHIEAGRIHNPQARRLNIFDMQGQSVYHGTQTDISLPEGIYLIHSDGVSRKVMITR